MFVYASSCFVSFVGVKDLTVEKTPDIVPVTGRARTRDVKRSVDVLQYQKREGRTLRRKAHRLWGWFDNFCEGGCFKIERLQVNDAACVSLQRHHGRAGRWVVVNRSVANHCGEKRFCSPKLSPLTCRWVR
jgi:mannose-1-phosphate guanylyltransferase/mannose-6-phosphate isomerase